MSSPFSLEHVADVRDVAGRIVERTRAHEDHARPRVKTAESTVVLASARAISASVRTASRGQSTTVLEDNRQRA
jgi:hypothetical protein